MAIPKIATRGLDSETIRRRVSESINNIVDFTFDDWRRRTAAEISAGITPTNYAYPPGDIRRYGAKLDGVTDDSAAVQAAINSGGAYHPGGTCLVESGLAFTASNQFVRGAGNSSVFKYDDSSGTFLDFAGYDFNVAEKFRLVSTNAAIGLDIGDISHWFKVSEIIVNGSDDGNDVGGDISGFTTAGIQIERSYYGTITRCDIAYCAKGIYGFREFNGNSISENSVRQCTRGIHISDATANSEGSRISGNTIESAQNGTVSGIEVEGADGVLIALNRIELSTSTATAHIYVHGGSAAALRGSVVDNFCIGTDPAVIFGTGTGSDNVVNWTLRGGFYNGAVTINDDCKWTTIDLDRRKIADGSTTLTNDGVQSILSYTDDSGFTVGITGLTTSPTTTWKFHVAKGIVSLFAQTLNGTSNTTACTITGLPALIRPTNTQRCHCPVQDNGTYVWGYGDVDSSGVITLSNGLAGGAFTNSGSKGILQCVLVYPLY